jgi:hypothetical protein
MHLHFNPSRIQQSTKLFVIQLTKISLKLFGIPVSPSSTNLTPSGGLLTKSRTSLATRAKVRGGKFSELPLLPYAADRAAVEIREVGRREEVGVDGLADCMVLL